MIPGGLDLGTLWVCLRLLPLIPSPQWEALQRETSVQVEFANLREVQETLTCGATLGPLSAEASEALVIPVQVEDHTFRFSISLEGGEGDADLYLRRDAPPGPHQYDRRPFLNGNRESLQVTHPHPGRWFLVVHGYRAFEGVSVTMDCVEEPVIEEEVSYEDQQELELAMYYELSGTSRTNRVIRGALRFERLRQEGREAFDAGNFRKAIEVWTDWSVQDPENPRPVSLVGDIHLRLGEIDQAINWYQKSLNVHPGQVGLMARLSRLMDVEGGKPVESRELLNRYNRIFPDNPAVALAQAEWLLRRKRFQEAEELIQRVLEVDPDSLNAHTLLHGLLRDQESRFENMQSILRIGRKPGREFALAAAVSDNQVLSQPESWVLMDFFERQSKQAPRESLRKQFLDLLPREEITVEDFRIGRMSANWVSSRDQLWGDDGNLILSADPSQTEAYLRLIRSDAMHNGFVEAEVEDTQGFFWIYARRGGGNMIRFGFEENGQLYLQVWIDNQLLSMQSRVWSREPGPANLRLELRGDGAYGYVNGRPAFQTPANIPDDMGLGWWGIAPWSPIYGRAKVSVREISGGPLPVRLGYLPKPRFRFSRHPEVQRVTSTKLLIPLKSRIHLLSGLAPEWLEQLPDGTVVKNPELRDLELRLLARYYRLRLLPAVEVRDPERLDLKQVEALVLREQLDGVTLVMNRLPPDSWIEDLKSQVSISSFTVHILLRDRRSGTAVVRELCSRVGLFAGPRHPRTLPLIPGKQVEVGDAAPPLSEDAVLTFPLEMR